jgi:rhodanese-related sulfurtransferase
MSAKGREVRQVPPSEAKRLLDEEGYTFVDVRSQREYDAGHPAGALNVPLLFASAHGMEPNPEFIEVMCGLFPPDAKLVLGCRSGQRSARAIQMLQTVGFTECVNQDAGFDGRRNAFGKVELEGWAGCGYPTETVTEGGSYEALHDKALGR